MLVYIRAKIIMKYFVCVCVCVRINDDAKHDKNRSEFFFPQNMQGTLMLFIAVELWLFIVNFTS